MAGENGETGVTVRLIGSYEYLNPVKLANSVAVTGIAAIRKLSTKNPNKYFFLKEKERHRDIIVA